MDCPRDHHELGDRFISGALTYRCPECAGMFIRKETLRKLYELTSSQLPRILASREFDESSQLASGIACPGDASPMGLRTYLGMELDVCSRCFGVWLDKGELELIWAVFAEGSGPDVMPRPQQQEPLNLKEALLTIPSVIKMIIEGILDFIGELVEARHRQ